MSRRSLLGYVVAAGCLVWILYDVDFKTLISGVMHLNGWYVLSAIAFDVLSYLFQGIRWVLLLQRPKRLPVLRATQAIYAGLFLNEVLPMRIGEIARGYLVARWLERGFATILPSMVVERLLDGLWLALGVSIAAIFVPLPASLLRVRNILGVAMALSTVFFAYVVVLRKEGMVETRRGKVAAFIHRFELKLREIGQSDFLYAACGVSALYFVSQMLSFWLVMQAYGLNLNLWTGAAVLLIIHMGTLIPNAPANVGTYQFFCTLGLTLLGVDKSVAAGFSIIVFLVLTVPLWIIGFFAVSHTGMTIGGLRRAAQTLASRET